MAVSKKYKLIVIDDSHDILELLKYNLASEGYEVKAFFNAVDALKYVTTDNTDLVITDWMLPEMDGLDLCRNLKHNPSTQEIPVVMLTCKSDEIDVVTALEVGAEEFIPKPVRMKEMLTRVKKILRRKTAEVKVPAAPGNKESIVRGRLQLDLAQHRSHECRALFQIFFPLFERPSVGSIGCGLALLKRNFYAQTLDQYRNSGRLDDVEKP